MYYYSTDTDISKGKVCGKILNIFRIKLLTFLSLYYIIYVYESEGGTGETVALQLIVDLYGCDAKLLDDMNHVQSAARDAVHSIGAQIVEECMHKFTPIGISYIAVISASHFSIHTWPEFRYAAVDVFSCSDDVPRAVADALRTAFHAETCRIQSVERNLKGECSI